MANANDLFGGLIKNFAAFMPKDDPNTKIFQAQTEISDLEKRETELYVQIGKKVFPAICSQPEYSEIVEELKSVQKRLVAAQSNLQKVQAEKLEREQQEKEELLGRTCPNCDTVNQEGMKFCQECGTKLGVSAKNNCPKCGMVNPVGTRFCGECGSPLQ